MALAIFWLSVVLGLQQALAQRPLGIDVSYFQGSDQTPPTNINWLTEKSAGITFAWTKATEGMTYTDPDFVYNMTHAKSAGVLIGAYHYAHPNTHTGTAGADIEASNYWSQAKNYLVAGGFYLMPVLDFEQDVHTNVPAYTQATLSAWANEWCQDIVNYGKSNGVILNPIIYTFTSYATGTAGYGPGLNSSVTNWPLWMASYPGGNVNTQGSAPASTTPWSTWAFWQYSSTNIVSGVSGQVDADVFNGTSNTIMAYVIGVPIISNQPVSVTVAQGSNATFSVLAGGSGTLHYQWQFNGTNVSGATTNQFTVTNAQTTNGGGYAVLVTNTSGKLLSSTAFLSVQGPLTNSPGGVIAPSGMVNWWPAEGNAIDIFGTGNGAPQGGFYYSTGESGLAFHLDGSTGVINTGLADLAVPWTACMWVNRQNSPQSSAGLLEDGTYSLKLEQYNGTRQVGLSVLGVGDYIFSPAYTVPAGTWTHLAFVGTSGGTSLYVNGVLKGTLANSIPLPRKYIGAGFVSSSSKYVDFTLGSLDEIMTFNRALNSTEINGIYAAGSAGFIRAPLFTGMGFTGAGQFQLGLEGLTGRTFTVRSSTDLVNWTNLGTISNAAGTNQYTDTAATNAQTFYRVSQP